MIRNLFFVALGSCLGGMSRYLAQHYINIYFPSRISVGTLVVNVTGCFIVGLLFAWAEKENALSPAARLFLITGFCGGYTTFSAIALENINMMRSGQLYVAIAYITLSVVLGLAATFAGIFLVKTFN